MKITCKIETDDESITIESSNPQNIITTLMSLEKKDILLALKKAKEKMIKKHGSKSQVNEPKDLPQKKSEHTEIIKLREFESDLDRDDCVYMFLEKCTDSFKLKVRMNNGGKNTEQEILEIIPWAGIKKLKYKSYHDILPVNRKNRIKTLNE